MASATPKVIILAGSNGSGKSTFAPLLLRDALSVLEYVNADTIASGLSAFHPDSAAFVAGRIMLSRIRDLAENKADFAFETTLASRSYAPCIKTLLSQGYQFHLLFLWLHSPDLALKRVESRVKQGGHDIPSNIIYRRYYRGINNFFQLYLPLTNSWIVYDNSTHHPVLLASGTKNSLEVANHQLWNLFKQGITQ